MKSVIDTKSNLLAPTLWPTLLRAGLIAFISLFQPVAQAQDDEPHREVRVSLTCLDQKSGKVIWNVPFPRHQIPIRSAVYRDGLLVVLSDTNASDNARSVVYFLDSKTGKPVRPFDTQATDEKRDYIRNGSGWQEFELPNHWVSYGVVRLRESTTSTNQVHFFSGSQMMWTLNLPSGVNNLAHWNDVLVFRQFAEENGKHINRLFGQTAGKDAPSWEFTLPEDVPDKNVRSINDVIYAPGQMWRNFEYIVGDQAIYIFGNGNLFALEPKNGKILWRYDVSKNSALAKSPIPFDDAEILDLGDSLLLASHGTMAQFEMGSPPKFTVLNKNLFENSYPVAVDGRIYCFTQKP